MLSARLSGAAPCGSAARLHGRVVRMAAAHAASLHCTANAPPAHSGPLQSARREREEQEKMLAEFELRRKIRATLVPTDDGKVREMLRQIGEPVTLFGEREVREGGGHPLNL